MTELTEFDSADLYGSEDDEVLSYDDPIEWLLCNGAEYWQPGDGPLEVVAFRPRSVSVSDSSRWAASAAESIGDMYGDDEYGGPDEDDFTDAYVPLARAIQAAIMRVVRDHVMTWSCEVVARRTYSEDELVQILKNAGVLE